MIKLCLSFVILLYICSCAIQLGCENCGCCVDNVCSTEVVDGYYVADYCTRGCIPGIGGNKCYNKCANDCVTCVQYLPNDCTTCDERKYITDNKRCVDCPKNCKNCTSATQCQECYPPYYNDGSKQACSLSCPRNCVCENLGVCSACQDGFYNVGNTCRSVCPETCTTCTDKNHCQSCKSSYSGDICCVKNGHCLNCSSSTVCEKCSDGYYGVQCGRTCPTKCKSSLCNKENGKCLSCQDGNYGTQCGKSCPKTCHQLQCEMNTGTCLSCDVGLYGNYCTENCSKTCLNDRCNIQNGRCSEGCIAAYTGENCTEVSIDREGTASPATYIGIGTVIGISATILVVIVTIIIVKKWKINFLRKNQGTSNDASYVNTQLQSTSIEAIDMSVKNDQIDLSQYERLGERYDKQSDEYDQIKSMNQ